MPDEHARLSPSAAERWLSCPASVLLAKEYPHTSSVYADEGTAAHTMGELKAQIRLMKLPEYRWKRVTEKLDIHRAYVVTQGYDLTEMEDHTDYYVDYLETLMEQNPGHVLFLEQRLQTGVPLCWGTGDAILVTAEKVFVVDLKYGAGVPVDAYENPQLMLYGVGALDTFGGVLGDVEEVTVTIFQPRLESVSSFTIAAEDLRAWRDSLLPVAEEALKPGAHFGPGPKACRWCPAAGDCRARMEYNTAQDFSTHPDRLSPEELGDLLHLTPEIQSWCKALEDYSLIKAQDGSIPGWKVVLSNGRRSITDQAVAVQTAIDMGWSASDVATLKTKGIGELERLMGKETFTEVFGPFISKSEGNPSLVPASDKRPALDRNAEAAKDFSDE